MGFVLFYYTLFVMLASILASATCLSAYLVSHRREMMFAVFGFLFYFFDVAWVLQDDFALLGDLQVVGVFAIVRSLVSVVTGGGCLMAFWLLLCDYLGGTNRALRVVPGVVYVLGSIAALTLLPDGNVQRFVFYTTRAMLLFWMLLYVGFRYFSSKDEVERNRLRRHRWLYVLVWVVGLLMVLEDASFFLVCEPNSIVMWPRTFVPERNFMENVLMLSLAFFACRDAFQVLSMRFERPPMHGGEVHRRAHQREPHGVRQASPAVRARAGGAAPRAAGQRQPEHRVHHAPGPEHREGARAQHPAKDGPAQPPGPHPGLLEDVVAKRAPSGARFVLSRTGAARRSGA